MNSISLPLLWFLLWLGTTSTATPIINKNDDAKIATRTYSLYPRAPRATGLPPQPGALVEIPDPKHPTTPKLGTVLSFTGNQLTVKVIPDPKPSAPGNILTVSFDINTGPSGFQVKRLPLRDGNRVTIIGKNPTAESNLQGRTGQTGTIEGKVGFDPATGTCTMAIKWDDESGTTTTVTGPRTWFEQKLGEKRVVKA